MYILNTLTGEGFAIDRKMSRIRHLQRRVHAWATGVDAFMKAQPYKYRMLMVRLSYAPPREWQAGDIRAFVIRLHKELGSNLVAYAWAAELFEKGGVHFHFLMVVRRGVVIPFFDDAGWWPWGYTHFSSGDVRTPFYICSYTSKAGYQKFGDFPEFMRIFAVWISEAVLTASQSWTFHISALPRWLVDCVDFLPVLGDRVRRRKGGDWSVGGRVYKSYYQVVLGEVDRCEYDYDRYYLRHPVSSWI